MTILIRALILVLLIASPCLGAEQSLVGTYKVVSHVVLVDGTPNEPLGKAPHGYLVLTPTRAIIFYTSENRKFGTSVADKAALLDTLAGWSGTYRIEGKKLIVRVDAHWAESWNGKDQVRNWTLSDNRLTWIGDPTPWARDQSKTAVVQQVWEKIE
jgi:hypothetical protein